MNYYAIHAVTLFTLAPSAAMDFVHDWVTFNAGYSVRSTDYTYMRTLTHASDAEHWKRPAGRQRGYGQSNNRRPACPAVNMGLITGKRMTAVHGCNSQPHSQPRQTHHDDDDGPLL